MPKDFTEESHFSLDAWGQNSVISYRSTIRHRNNFSSGKKLSCMAGSQVSKKKFKFKVIHLSNSCHIYNSFCTCTFWSFCTFIFLCQFDTRASTLLPQSIAHTTLNPPSHRSKPNNIYNGGCNQGEKYSTCQSSKAVKYDICYPSY